MKKLLVFLLAGIMAVSVCACGGSQGKQSSTGTESIAAVSEEASKAEESTPAEASAETSAESTADSEASPLKDAFEKVKTEVTLPEEMSDFSEKRIERVFGITTEQMEDFAGGVCTDGVKQDQIIYIKAAKDEDVADIQEKLQNNRDAIYNVIQNYDPKQQANIENAKVETNGLYVSLVISADADKIKSIFSETLGI